MDTNTQVDKSQVKLFKFTSGEEFIARIKVTSPEGYSVDRPVIIYYNDEGQLTMGDWIRFSPVDSFFIKSNDLAISPVDVFPDMVDSYFNWSKDKDYFLRTGKLVNETEDAAIIESRDFIKH